MELHKARIIADRVLKGLEPYCSRIQIAGSIRRCKDEVKDIEIVCIPKMIMADMGKNMDLFGSPVATKQPVYADGFIQEVKKYHINKGKPTGKYIQFMVQEGINVDLFTATPNNWGYIVAIRTGSADYSHRVLATAWCKAGYKGIDGMLYKNGVAVPVPEEIDLFKMIGVKWTEPKERGW